MSDLKKLTALFYATLSGKEPVREWLLGLNDGDRKIIGDDIRTAEFAWPIGMPLCKPMGSGLWEIRSDISDKRIARVLFSPIEGHMVLLHGFIKKAKKTPKPDLDLAVKRMKEAKNEKEK